MVSGHHHYWMAEALRQARKGFYSTPPNPRVGCVVVQDDRMCAAGWHEFTGGPHAEANAISKVASSTQSCHGSTLYITMSPCRECSKLIHQAGIIRVVYQEQYKDGEGIGFLERAGVEVKMIENLD